MPIPRVHLFEFTDQSWLPAIIRDLLTDYLHFVSRKFALHRPAVPLVRELLGKTNRSQIVDLCSGAGGAVLAVAEQLATEGLPVHLTLTDKFPHLNATSGEMEKENGAWFYPGSVDAQNVPSQLSGVRTIFNGFHHFRPQAARAILEGAVRAGEGIGIFEFPDRRWPAILGNFLLVPPVVLVASIFIRPVRLARLVLTYLLPIVPIVTWWDGTVSQFRAYTPKELEDLGYAAGANGYYWRSGRVKIGPKQGEMTYLIGYPARGV